MYSELSNKSSFELSVVMGKRHVQKGSVLPNIRENDGYDQRRTPVANIEEYQS